MPLEPKEPTGYIGAECCLEPPFSDLDEKIEALMEQRENRLLGRILKTTVQAVSWPSIALSNFVLEMRVKEMIETEGFKKFESRQAHCIKQPTHYSSVFEYLDALLIADQLSAGLAAVGHKLPDVVRAIDVGCGRTWFYATILYELLKNYNAETPRKVELDGIDLRATDRTIRAFYRAVQGNKDIRFKRGDVLNLDGKNGYDFIFMHKMLTSPSHFREWKLEPIAVEQIIKKCLEMLKPEGIYFIINLEQAGEYVSVVETVPPGRRIAEFGYKVDVGNPILDCMLTPGIDRRYRSGICICRK